MKNEAITKARINELVETLTKELDLEWWVVRNKFSTSLDSDRIVCQAVADWEYRQATLKWNLTVVLTMEDSDLEATVIHELVHVMNACLWESIPEGKLKDGLYKLNELATENVSRAIVNIRKGARDGKQDTSGGSSAA